jgi:hypothetical protein
MARPNVPELSGERSGLVAEVFVELGHATTIRLGRTAVQRAGACDGRKPLSRKGRAFLLRDVRLGAEGRESEVTMPARPIPQNKECARASNVSASV